MPGVANMNEARATERIGMCAVAIARKGQLVMRSDLVEQALGLRPEGAGFALPVVQRRGAPGGLVIAADRPEIGEADRAVRGGAARCHDTGHLAGRLVALLQRCLVERAIFRPGQGGPECAIGEFRARCSRQGRAHAERIDDKVEAFQELPRFQDDVARLRIDAFDAPGGEQFGAGLCRGRQKPVEQEPALHAIADEPGPQMLEPNIEDRALRRCRQAPQPLQRAAELSDIVCQSKVLEDGEAGHLQHQARADRGRRVELVEQGDAVSLPGQKGSGRKASDPGPANGNVQRSPHDPTS